MADRPDVQTQPLPRDELSRFLPTQRAIRAFEHLQNDVTEVLPDAAQAAAAAAEAAQAAADAALLAAQAAAAAAAAAQAAADAALALAQDLEQASTTGPLMADMQALRNRIASLEQGPTQ